MPLTAEEYKTQIIEEVGDTPSGVLANGIDRYWTGADREATLELQYLKAKMSAIRAAMGAERRTNVDMQGLGGVASKLFQRMTSLKDMLADTRTEYNVKVTSAGAYAGAVGQLETTAPVAPPAGAPDANSLDYAGNPYTTRAR